MIHLVYTSIATETVTPSLVLSMLDSARRNNAPRGITGLLYCAQGQFAQCLEGDEDAVNEIFTRIACDPRHRHLQVFRHAAPNERLFTDWSMAFVDSSTAEAARTLMGHGLNTYEASKWPSEKILPLLQTFGESLRAERIPVTY